MASEKISVDVEVREDRGKNFCGRLRRDGRVPGNVYGLDRPPVAVSVASRTIRGVLRSGAGQNAILTLKAGEGKARDVMIRELQRDPVTGNVTHVDFIRLDLTEMLEVQVPVHLVGTPLGVKNDGGILDFVHREVEVRCLPTAIPEFIEVDVSALEIGHHIELKDLPTYENVEYHEDPETVIAVVAAPRIEEEPVEEEEAAAEVAAGDEETKEAGKEGESADQDKDKDKKD